MKEILRILEEDARLSPEEIAAMTGTPVDEVRSIIAECEKKGIIRCYKAVIDWDQLGEELVFAFIDVRVLPERGVGFDDIAERIYRFPEVHSVYLVSGTQDLRVVVGGNDMKEVAFFVAEKLSTIERVQSTSTHFLLKKYKSDGVIFDNPEPDRRLIVAP
jgi:DNA-binding Lrp family transcriptional regulator